MRVIVNGIPLLSPRSGVGEYIYQTFSSMQALPGEWKTTFYYGFEWSPLLKDQPTAPYVQARRFVQLLKRAYPLSRAVTDLLFGLGQWKRKFNLYHETNFIPMRFNGPTVATVFDLSFQLFPETHPKQRIEYMKRYFYPRLERVTHFVTISEAVKGEMIRYLNLPEDSITVTPLGVNKKFKPIFSDQLHPIINKYGLKADRYVLYVGTLEPRKNILNIVRAYARLPLALREVYPLVLAGGAGWLMEELSREIGQLGVGANVIKTGYIPEGDLPALYSGATLFIYPSIYEGFGLPPLEAMACGTAVITSNVSSLPEVVGDAGVLVHPQDVEKLADEMEDLLTNPSRREILCKRGLERSKQFTWEKCAAQTLKVYNQVVQSY